MKRSVGSKRGSGSLPAEAGFRNKAWLCCFVGDYAIRNLPGLVSEDGLAGNRLLGRIFVEVEFNHSVPKRQSRGSYTLIAGRSSAAMSASISRLLAW
jgi:hypothetical protein